MIVFHPTLRGGERILRRIIACLAIAVAGPLASADSVIWLTSDLPPHPIAAGDVSLAVWPE